MKRLLAGAMVLMFVLSTPMAAAATPAPAPQTTSLWKVSSDARILYVTGSTQLLTKLDYPLPRPITDAFADSRGLLLAGDPGAERKAIAALLKSAGTLPPGETLLGQLTAKQQKTFKQALALTNVPLDKVNHLKSWLAGLELTRAALGQLGVTPEYSETQYFYTQAGMRDMPIHFLETAAGQIRLFAGLPESLQIQWLMLQAEGMDKLLDGFGKVVSAWRRGDTEALVELIHGSLADHPELYDALVTQRNNDWERSLQNWLDSKGPPLFVLVGIGNLIGPDGLLARLRDDGYTVTQL